MVYSIKEATFPFFYKMMHLDCQKSLRELIILFANLYVLTNFALFLKHFREPNVFTVHCKHEIHQHEDNVLECTSTTKAV